MSRISLDLTAEKLAKVENFFHKDVASFQSCLNDLEREITPDAEPVQGDRYHQRILEAFQKSQDSCREFEAEHGDDPRMIQEVQDGFRKETARWFNQSWIAHRARSKPSGFAGDYEMLIKLYAVEPPNRGLGGYLDLCIQDLPLARAVRTRLKATRKFLLDEVAARQGKARILDIASGPCREFVDWPRDIGGALEIVAMDSDPLALDFVNREVAPQFKAGDLKAIHYNALRTRSAETTIEKFGRFDVIYSVGLCDYLPDKHLQRLLQAWHETLADNGVLLVAFKDRERYDQTPYQWHLDWFFFQRTYEDCMALYEAAGFDVNAIETVRDDTGIIMHFIDRSPADSRQRVDQAESIRPPMSVAEQDTPVRSKPKPK